MDRTKGSPGAPSPCVPTFSSSPVVRRLLAHTESQCTSTAGSQNHLQTCRCRRDQSYLSQVHIKPSASRFIRAVMVLLAGCCSLERGALCAGSSFQKRFFILTKSSVQTFPFCWKSLQTLAKPFPLIFLHLAKTTQTVCLQGRLSQDIGEESIICNARKYNLHISKAFSVKTNTQQRLGGQTPVAFKLLCSAIV